MKKDGKKTADGKRAYFDGTDAPEKIKKLFIDKRTPERFRKKGLSNPCLYCDRNIGEIEETDTINK